MLSLQAMDLSLFGADGVAFLFRWVHLLAGVAWLGLLYYFNFVQAPFFATTEPAVRTGVTRGMMPRALAWFRWGAVATVLSGLVMLGVRVAQAGPSVLGANWGVLIQLGATIGIVMFLNVWLIIWPKQRIVVASTESVATGGPADARAAAAADRAFLASRTNVVLSFPMLLLMGAASHLQILGAEESGVLPTVLSLLAVAAFEGVAVWGQRGRGPAKMLEKPFVVAHVGLALSVVIYLLLELAVT